VGGLAGRRAAAVTLSPILASQGFVVLDGGLATELERRGADLRDPAEARRLIALSVELARQARDSFWSAVGRDAEGRVRPLVAGSVGPYGAALADG